MDRDEGVNQSLAVKLPVVIPFGLVWMSYFLLTVAGQCLHLVIGVLGALVVAWRRDYHAAETSRLWALYWIGGLIPWVVLSWPFLF